MKIKAAVIGSVLGLSMGVVGTASATHIDQLGINITLNSSDGAGNFTLKYDQYYGADSTSGIGPFNPGGTAASPNSWWDATTTSNLSISESTQGAAITGSTSFSTAFLGIVDDDGSQAGTFGAAQADQQFVNDANDAGLYSAIVAFSITGFDSNLSYLVNVAATDCCYVIDNSNGPSFSGSLSFDPSVVAVPEPGVLALLGLGMLGVGLSRKKLAA